MTLTTLTSLQNPLVKQLRKLHRGKERRKQGVFLIEGTHLLETACEVRYPLDVLCATEDWIGKHPELWETATAQTQRWAVVSAEVLGAIATTVNPDGVVATAISQSNNPPSPDLSLGLVGERLQDPGNLGTMIRTATATQVEGMWLSQDSVDLENPKVLRASTGSWFCLPMGISDNLPETVQDHKKRMQVVATVPHADLCYWDVDFAQPTLILLGNEGAGLSPELIALADIQVQIPLGPGVESLNVAIASAVLLYEARRQRFLRKIV
jgi:TrmH family RNA methyltransferase